jgi:hypothetical protein
VIHIEFSGVILDLNGKYGKGKANPVTNHEGSYSCGMSKLPHFLDNGLTDGYEIASFKRRLHFSSRRYLALTSVRSRVNPMAIVQLEGLGQLKNPISCEQYFWYFAGTYFL